MPVRAKRSGWYFGTRAFFCEQNEIPERSGARTAAREIVLALLRIPVGILRFAQDARCLVKPDVRQIDG